MTTISYAGGSPITPHLALIASHAQRAQSNTIVHQILDGPPVYTLRDANPSTGTLALLFRTEQAARDALAVHKLASAFRIADSNRAALNFRYVVTGEISIRLDEGTAALYIVEIPYQETT